MTDRSTAASDRIRPSLRLFLLVCLIHGGAAQAEPPPAYGLNGGFNPSMAIIVVVLVSAFFFMGFFSIYLRHCGGESTSVRTGSQGGVRGLSRRAARGIDPAVIGTFPTFEYSEVKNLKLGKGALECAVCLSEFEDDETLRLLPKCSHVFHPDCIGMWLGSHTTCPVCRTNLAPEPEPASLPGAGSGDLESTGSGESETSDLHEVVIAVDESPPSTAAAAPSPPAVQSRPPWSRSSRRPPRKFPRSYSTGHCLVNPGENTERYTLRLPDNIRRELVSRRTDSCNAPANGSISVRRGFRIGGEGSSRGGVTGRSERAAKSDRWIFSLSRTWSLVSPTKKGSARTAPFEPLGDKPEPGAVDPGSSRRSTIPVFTVSTPPPECQ